MGAELVEILEDCGVSGTRPPSNRGDDARMAALLDAWNPHVDA